MEHLRIHYLQHVPFEDPGSLLTWAGERKARVTYTPLYEDPSLPPGNTIDFLVIMGGPMSVNDDMKFPWFSAEKQFIENMIRAGKKVLGICLGSQLIADVLGCRVYHNHEKEIGWLPVRFTEDALKTSLCRALPHEFTSFHWHGETFDLPHGAIHLVSSEACTNQAYIFENKVLGIQFHPEITGGLLKQMLHYQRYDLIPAPFVQDEQEILSRPELIRENQLLFSTLLDRFLAM